MGIFRSSSLLPLLAAVATGAVMFACSDDAADKLGGRNNPGGSSGGNGTLPDGGVDPNNPNGNGSNVPQEEALFRALEPDMQKKCGGPCHTEATYKPTPPAFLAPPDAYKSIKAYSGIVVADTYQSLILTKGPHEGPAVNPDTDPEFYGKVKAWLDAEALALSAAKKPTTDPGTIAAGANDIDMTKACAMPLTGVHVKFDASIVGGMLELTNLRVTAPAGTDVHLAHPVFLRITGSGAMQKVIADPADTFSNIDTTVPQGTETKLVPSEALFSGSGWRPVDLANDKFAIQVDKLEPGKVAVISMAPTCKNPALFASNILPAMKGASTFTPNCANCHGNGLAGMALNGADTTAICNQVLGKIDTSDITKSLIITKVTVGPHNGGTINDATGWTNLFKTNQGAFF